eukprot:TRINITY_DN662_c0_g1_i3.p1 TRINITY_DN662_c0_g1~~TRINITY_DN662_c0_g1_i3.p1  ORF type:complete len:893 (+),score=310.14 TRINITY_DN662_c0_g1_i3:149-2827(+)
MPSSNPLPPKENALFKRILKCYEQKQYKNGLKFSKQILSNARFSEHGETLAMKGLTLNCLGRKEEAYDYVRRGLRNDVKSHVCWHVYGLLQRSDKKYEEAIKCYRNALKCDKINIQILRDLSLLQIQMRDLEGYKETRFQIFSIRPAQRSSWIGFAMSYHLLEDYDMALKILGEFRETYEKTTYDFEHSELLLYQNMVMHESGDVSGALSHLDKYEKQICDKMTLLETRGKYFLHLGRSEEAESIYRGLIQRNPENHSYYERLIDSLQIREDEDKQLEMFNSYAEKAPRAQGPRRLALAVAKGSTFKKLLDAYLKKALRKGVPPLFVDLRSLYSDPDKVRIIEETMRAYMENLLEYSSFEVKGEDEPVTAVLWVYYYLGQHYDFLGDHTTALDIVDRAIEHTPTLIELLLLKGKINKHVGNIEEAVKYLSEAQSLDTADRYLNCKCAKYLLRANKVSEAEEMCQRFTREGVTAMENLNEMQCMWFQTECALAYWRKGMFGDALKKCIEVDRHFTDMVEDQFDFHTYCMRKMTLRSYIELLRFEDQLRSHCFYEKAAHLAIRIYLQLFDKPLPDTNTHDLIDTENLDPSEIKKIRNKQKKALRKAEQEQQQLQQVQAKKNLHNKAQKKNDDELDIPLKEELFSQKLERPSSPLTEAIKFLTPLQSLCSGKIETQLLAFEIYFRKDKPLLMLKCIKKMKNILSDTSLKALPPKVYQLFSKFHRHMESNLSRFPEPVKTVIQQESAELFGDKSSAQRNEEFMSSNAGSLEHLLEGARVMAYLDPSRSQQALKYITSLDEAMKGVNIERCSEVYDDLTTGIFGSAGKSAADAYRAACSARFPLTPKFKSPEEKAEKKKEEAEKRIEGKNDTNKTTGIGADNYNKSESLVNNHCEES